MKTTFAALLLILSLLLSGCVGGQQQDTQAGEQLLTALFTSNQDGRWDTFQSAAENGGDVETATLDYLDAFQPFCTADGLTVLTNNRYPAQCDGLAQQYDVILQPGEVTLSVPNQNDVSSFSLPLSIVSDGQVIGSVTLEGQLIFAEEGGALLVDNLSIYNLDALSTALAGG